MVVTLQYEERYLKRPGRAIFPLRNVEALFRSIELEGR